MNYYNEYDKGAAQWLRELIAAGEIPDGHVDERSIVDVRFSDLAGYTQCHFFAGIGGWSYALRLADWPEDRPVWTGSCPCQPFSTAGKQIGRADPRHLWPAFRRLVNKCHPPVVFGEQVASAAGREWLAGVRSNLETMGYAVGASDLCAAGVGAPHIRQRLYWLADSTSVQRTGCGDHGRGCCKVLGREPESGNCGDSGVLGRLGNTNIPGSQGRIERRDCSGQQSPWASSVALACSDGKTRRVEPTIFPLVDGVPGYIRVGLLRGAGNAIVPQVAQAFIEAYLDL